MTVWWVGHDCCVYLLDWISLRPKNNTRPTIKWRLITIHTLSKNDLFVVRVPLCKKTLFKELFIIESIPLTNQFRAKTWLQIYQTKIHHILGHDWLLQLLLYVIYDEMNGVSYKIGMSLCLSADVILWTWLDLLYD